MSGVIQGRGSPVLWVVTDQLPFPARNGITLPVFNYLRLLSPFYSLRLVLLCNSAEPLASDALQQNEALFGEIIQVPLRRWPTWRRALSELGGREMYQHGWSPTSRALEAAALRGAPDAVLVSPMSAVAKWRACGGLVLSGGKPTGAAVNDCTAAEYYFRGQSQIGGGRQKAKGLVDRLRSHRIARIEGKLLMPYQVVYLQTPRDRDLMEALVSKGVAKKVVVAPNGVNPAFLSLQRKPGHTLVFVGEMSGEYGDIVRWLLKDVWPRVMDCHPQLRLQIVGRGASAELAALMVAAERVSSIEYVQDLADVYRHAMIAICPVFKGFGLINKTIEAMACGVPVVGGAAAFNGIPGFLPGVHGAVCGPRTTHHFVEALRGLIVDGDRRESIATKGRTLIEEGFDWNVTVTRIAESMRNSVQPSA